MKHSGLALAVLAGLSVAISSCVPNPVNNEEPNALVAAPRVLHLTKSGDSVTSSVALKCGCPFALEITSYAGDTGAIKYKLYTPLTTHVSPHDITFYVPTEIASGSYSTTMQLHVHDDNNLDFYDTIRVSMP
jgi:hypothetical protein